MRLNGPKSIAAPARVVLDVFLAMTGVLVAGAVVITALLLVNPLNPIREYYQVTTVIAVPPTVWHPQDVVRVDPGVATVRVEPWAYLRFMPVSRSFVAVTGTANLAWWACVVLMLLQLRRAFVNIAAGAPFPRDNIRRIRMTGLAILGMAAVQLLVDLYGLTYIRAITAVAGQRPTIPTELLLADFPLATLLAGAAVLFLAEIYRAGADLQDDQALTV